MNPRIQGCELLRAKLRVLEREYGDLTLRPMSAKEIDSRREARGSLKAEIVEIEKLADDFISNHDEEGEVEFNNRWIMAEDLQHRGAYEYTEVLILSDVNDQSFMAPNVQMFTCLIRSSSGSAGNAVSVSDAVTLTRRVLEQWGVLPKTENDD